MHGVSGRKFPELGYPSYNKRSYTALTSDFRGIYNPLLIRISPHGSHFSAVHPSYEGSPKLIPYKDLRPQRASISAGSSPPLARLPQPDPFASPFARGWHVPLARWRGSATNTTSARRPVIAFRPSCPRPSCHRLSVPPRRR